MKRRRMKMMMMRKMMNPSSCLEGGNVMSSITLMYVYPSSLSLLISVLLKSA